MRTFVVILALAAVAAADVSHIVNSNDADSVILKQDADVFPDKYQYIYETSNGISAQESGALKNAGREDEGISVSGSFSFRGYDNNPYSVSYIADENGYQPQGAHLPTTPAPIPIPDYIQRAIEYIRTHPPKPEPGSKY